MKKSHILILAAVFSMLNGVPIIHAQQELPNFTRITAEELIERRARAQEGLRPMAPIFSRNGYPTNQIKNRITGAFGIKFGDTIPSELLESDIPTTMDGKFLQYIATPSIPIAPQLDTIYSVKVTPVEQRVFEIIATCLVKTDDSHLTAFELGEQLQNILEKKYGKTNEKNSANGGSVYVVTFRESSSAKSPFIQISMNNKEGKVTVVYQDPSIKEAAKTEYVEQTTGKLNANAF